MTHRSQIGASGGSQIGASGGEPGDKDAPNHPAMLGKAPGNDK